jgi:FkbM family methyltransferase
MFYKLLNAYTQQFSFPQRGLKYFMRLAKALGIADKLYIKQLPDGFKMNLNPTEHIQQQLFWYGYYEKELGETLIKLLKQNDIFLDIGANIGYFSLLAAKNGANVFAFEPAKQLFEKLEKNISINGNVNAAPFNVAVGELSEEKDLFLSGPDNLGMSSLQKPENYSGNSQRVKVVSIDEWFENSGLPGIQVIKIDVEGSELAVLKGMKKVLEIHKPVLLIEVNHETLSLFGLSPHDIYSYLNQFNFESFTISEEATLIKSSYHDHEQTINVLFIHPEKKMLYNKLFSD